MLSDCCLSCLTCLSVCLSVRLVYCGQTVRWIKMKLGMQVGLGPGHIVLDGDPSPSPQRGTVPPIFDPYLLWQNGWMDQGSTSYGGRSQSRPHCVRWGPAPSPPQKKGGAQPNFRPMSILAKWLPISAPVEHLSVFIIGSKSLYCVYFGAS